MNHVSIDQQIKSCEIFFSVKVIRMALDSSIAERNLDETEAEAEDRKHYGDYVDLCVLKYGANGVLEVAPDFTHNRKPYTIEVKKS